MPAFCFTCRMEQGNTMQVGVTLEGRIEGLIAPSLQTLGYDLIRVRMISGDARNILQIMIERVGGTQVNVDDCEKASRQISAVLDVENAISDHYVLEVSSPGIDRPLTRMKDFDTYKGLEAKLETADKIDGSKRFRGRIVGLEGDVVLLDINVVSLKKATEVVPPLRIEFSNIRNAKLVLNDELLAMHKSTNI